MAEYSDAFLRFILGDKRFNELKDAEARNPNPTWGEVFSDAGTALGGRASDLFSVFTGTVAPSVGKGLTIDVFHEFRDQLSRVGLDPGDAGFWGQQSFEEQPDFSGFNPDQQKVLREIRNSLRFREGNILEQQILDNISVPDLAAFSTDIGSIGIDEFTRTFQAFGMAWMKENPNANPENLWDDDNFKQSLDTYITHVVEASLILGPNLLLYNEDGSQRSATNAERGRLLANIQESASQVGGIIESTFTTVMSPSWTDATFPDGTEIADINTGQISDEQWDATIDLFVGADEDQEIISYIQENRAFIAQEFFDSGRTAEDIDTYLDGWISINILTDDARAAISQTQNKSINVTGPDAILDPLINQLIGPNLGLELDIVTRSAIKNFLLQEQPRNFDLSKTELFNNFDARAYRGVVDNELTYYFADQPNGEAWLEQFQATGQTFSGLLFATPDGQERLGLNTTGTMEDFMESVFIYGESQNILRPAPNVIVDGPESINATVFYKELFSAQFQGMDIYMRGQIINHLVDRASLEGFDIYNSDTAEQISDFFMNAGRFESVARSTISNILIANGLEGQALLDKLQERGDFLNDYKSLPIPHSAFTQDSFQLALNPILEQYTIPEEIDPVLPDPQEAIDAAIADFLTPIIGDLPLNLQSIAISRANEFMAVQRNLNPTLTDEEIQELFDPDEGDFTEILQGELSNVLRRQFEGDKLVESLFEAAGGPLEFFQKARESGVSAEDLDPARLGAFARESPEIFTGMFEGEDISGFELELAEDEAEADFQERLDEANRLAAEDDIVRAEESRAFEASPEGIALREQQRQRERRNVARTMFEPELERAAGDVLGINRARFVQQDFGDQLFEEFFSREEARSPAENIFLRDTTIGTPAGVTPESQRGLEFQQEFQQQRLPERLVELSNQSLIARQRFYSTQGQRRQQRNLGGL